MSENEEPVEEEAEYVELEVDEHGVPLSNQPVGDGIYDPVDEYEENDDVEYPPPNQTSGIKHYVDPDHHTSGNMDHVEGAEISLETGQVVVPGEEGATKPADGDVGADPATPEDPDNALSPEEAAQ